MAVVISVTSKVSLSPHICDMLYAVSHPIFHIMPVTVTSFLSRQIWQCHLTSVTPRVWLLTPICHMLDEVLHHICHHTWEYHITAGTTHLCVISHGHNLHVVAKTYLSHTDYVCHITTFTTPCDCHLTCVIMGKCHIISVTLSLWLSCHFCLHTHGSVTWHLSHQDCDCHLTFVTCITEYHIGYVITHENVT